MGNDFDLDAFEQDLDDTLKRGREAFRGKYKDQLNELLGLSREEIDRITADTTDLAVYDELITVVKEASRANMAQAQLKNRIMKLGDIAVEIARKVPTLAGMFA